MATVSSKKENRQRSDYTSAIFTVLEINRSYRTDNQWEVLEPNADSSNTTTDKNTAKEAKTIVVRFFLTLRIWTLDTESVGLYSHLLRISADCYHRYTLIIFCL